LPSTYLLLQDKYEYEIVGHSGEDHELPLVMAGKPPKTDKERLAVLRCIEAHAQYCMSGDTTLQATKAAVARLSPEGGGGGDGSGGSGGGGLAHRGAEADERFVFVFSDANLRRYGIPPAALGKALKADPAVNAYALFIASLGKEADELKQAMPPGRAFTVMDLAALPATFQAIFANAALSQQATA
jgi:hypothetical protein